MDFTFGGKYRLEEEIAMGGCGTVFSGIHTIAGKEVAIKLEPAIPYYPPESDPSQNPKASPANPNRNRAHGHPRRRHTTLLSPLKQESKVYKTLMGGPGVPWIMWSGKQGDYNVLVLDMLGPSLEDLFKMCNRHFTLKTVLLIADQLISRLEYIHSRDFVHRDVKPANFVMGTEKSAHEVNVIDFGLAKKFRDPRTGGHIAYRQEGHHGVGTSLFASLNTHEGIECSRRDDLESLAYMLIYFLRGTLPWRKTKGSTIAETWALIHAAKIASLPTLTAGLPAEFAVFFEYARGLEFADLPDYEGLRDLFRGLAERVGVKYDGVFDWTLGPVRGGRRRFCGACNARREAEDGGTSANVGWR
ncbi:kinase-like domain-containing protein [Hygrophoropsis aurantiaca]|uniref:Kinase-like domain-containing protein n=1 Tax=Hygrophoropsis aurantiaca TaxID=72124 RepID=A0ACB8A8I9_9AGAM|nr:kinase-like domain-containing protein [Hygrophoropsis aurantiaca]